MEELPEEFNRLLAEEGLRSSQLLLLNSGEWFDLETGSASAPFTPPDPSERNRYVTEVLAPKKFLYEEAGSADPDPAEDLSSRLREAQARMRRYQDRDGYRSDWNVYLDAGQGWLYRIPFDGASLVERSAPGTEREPFVRIQMDHRLLTLILDRKAHWNNAAIGSHLRFYRRPEQFERGVYHFLSYLHN